MNVKPSLARRGLQAAVILFAIGMAGAFVVYSQRKADRAMIRGTKSTQVLEDLRMQDAAQRDPSQASSPGRNTMELSPEKQHSLVISGTKSGSLALSPSPLSFDPARDSQPARPSESQNPRPITLVMSGSKSYSGGTFIGPDILGILATPPPRPEQVPTFKPEAVLSLEMPLATVPIPRATSTFTAFEKVMAERAILERSLLSTVITSSKSGPVFKPEPVISPAPPPDTPSRQRVESPEARVLAAQDQMNSETLRRTVLVGSSKSSAMLTPERPASPDANRDSAPNWSHAPKEGRSFPVLISSSKSAIRAGVFMSGEELAPAETISRQTGTVVIPGLNPAPVSDMFGFIHVAPKSPSPTDLLPDLRDRDNFADESGGVSVSGSKFRVTANESDSELGHSVSFMLKAAEERFPDSQRMLSISLDQTTLIPIPKFAPRLSRKPPEIIPILPIGRPKPKGPLDITQFRNKAPWRTALILSSKSGPIFSPEPMKPFTMDDEIPSIEEPIRIGILSVQPPEPPEPPDAEELLRKRLRRREESAPTPNPVPAFQAPFPKNR